MGYHTAAEIPNYWTYAKDFVLEDHMFEPVKSWSLPDHLYLVSAWSAKCKNAIADELRQQHRRARTAPRRFDRAVDTRSCAPGPPTSIDLAWTDITWLLFVHHCQLGLLRPDRHPARLRRRLGRDLRPGRAERHDPGDLEPAAAVRRRPGRPPAQQHPGPGLLLRAAKAGTLPAVSWITPSRPTASTRRPASTRARPTSPSIINAAMKSPDWDSTAIFLAWDDWGGFYDHVVPPAVDQNGYGLRVPAWSSRPTPGGVHRPPDPVQRRLPEVHRG